MLLERHPAWYCVRWHMIVIAAMSGCPLNER
jgi:hypothetical protein